MQQFSGSFKGKKSRIFATVILPFAKMRLQLPFLAHLGRLVLA
jgi:hypothetical protein